MPVNFNIPKKDTYSFDTDEVIEGPGVDFNIPRKTVQEQPKQESGGIRKSLSKLFGPAKAVEEFTFEKTRNLPLATQNAPFPVGQISTAIEKAPDFLPFLEPIRKQARETQARLISGLTAAPVDPTTYAFLGAASIPKLALRAVATTTVGALGTALRDPEAGIAEIVTGGALSGILGTILPVKSSVSSLKRAKKVLTPAQVKVAELIKKRHGEIATGQFDSELFVRGLEESMTKLERETIPFMLEGTDVPSKLGRVDIVNTLKDKASSDRLKPFAESIRSYLDDAHKFLTENYGDDIGFAEDYVPRIWDVSKSKMPQVVNWFVTKNPHLKNRTIGTIKAGVDEMGLTPKTLDVAELIRTYDQFKVKAVANIKFTKGLASLTDQEGNALVARIDKAPPDWITVDHPALRRAAGHMIKSEKGEQLILNKIPVKIHPEIADLAQVVLDQPFSAPAINALEGINAFAKKSMLSLSLFHHIALTESAVASGIGKKAAKLWNPVRVFKALRNKEYDIFLPKNQAVTRDGLEHGLQLGAIPDVQVGRVRAMLQNVEKRTSGIPVLGKFTKALRGANDLWDSGLWDYYHNSLKMYAYEHFYNRSIKSALAKGQSNINTKQIKTEIAQFVNDTFGGQSWDLLHVNPKYQQMAHWLMLAPDWTLSTLRQAASVGGLGSTSAETAALRQAMGVSFWTKGAIYFWGGLNLLNYGITKKATGEGRFMWDNTPGHKTHLFVGHNEDGTEQYLRWGKQFRELPEFFINPIAKFGAKLSPVVRASVIQFTGRAPGSTFSERFAEKPFVESLPGRAKALGKGVLPFSISSVARSDSILGIGFPISKGMTPFKARQLFQDAIERKDDDRIKEVWVSALKNNLDANSLFVQARSSFKSDKTFEAKRTARELFLELKQLGPVEGRKRIKELKESGEITPAIEKQLIRIAKQEKSVRIQKSRLGIN